MTESQLLEFIAAKQTADPITWGDFKKLIVFEQMFLARATKIPMDIETIAMYTKLDIKDLRTVIDSMKGDGLITETSHPMMEEKILKLNLEESNEKPAFSATIQIIEA